MLESRRTKDMNKGESTRRRIVAQAAPVFNQKGFAGTAISDLMQATGLEKGGIYRHFESKQELAEDAFDYAWNAAMESRFAGIDEVPNAVDRLKQFIINFRDRRGGLVPGGCPIINTGVEADDSNPQLHAKVRQALAEWLDRLKAVIKDGQRQGEIRRKLDPEELATFIVSNLEGGLLLSRLQRATEPLHISCAHLIDFLETNVRAKK
jgi:TetR/AcrR family transcriptional regulator, transcriptional repressor for nem operon